MSLGPAASAPASPAAQQSAPYLDAITAYGFRGPTRFHVPGHKGGPGADPGLRRAIGDALALDVNQELDGVDVGEWPTPYDRAELLAAEAHGAQRTWFLTNGATQGNHALCLALAPPGEPVLAQRNCHASLVDGLVLSGGAPRWLAPECDRELGMAHGVTPDNLAAALRALEPRPSTAFIISPTYYGMAADVAGCAEVVHAAGAALVVDQAWGPHFGFHPALPQSALAAGADAVLTSTHKIAGSLTQSAMLHVGPAARVDVERLARAVRLVRSTSVSSLLLASLDSARRQLAVHGEALIERTLVEARGAREDIDAVPGCHVVGEDLVGRPGVAGWDPLRLTIDVRETGASGYELADALRSRFDDHVELATHATVVLVLGIAQPAQALGDFVHDFAGVVRAATRPGTAGWVAPPGRSLDAETVISPREAFLGRTEVVAVDHAVGRVSSEAIAGYPPGIPALLPGERISAEVVAYLRELRRAGARLHGASDPAFATINVVADG